MAVPVPPPFPREHGAWTMLAIPVVLGLAAGGWRSPGAWLIPIATLCVFLAHHAFVPWLRRAREGKTRPPGFASRRLLWGVVPLTLSFVVFAYALAVTPSPARNTALAVACGAAVLAAVYALAGVFGTDRSVLPELLGMAGMSLNAAMIAACAGRPLSRALFGGAWLSLGYCASSLAFVRAYERMRTARRQAVIEGVIAQLAIAALLIAGADAGVVSRGWWVAFVPVAVRTGWGLIRPPANLRQLGLREVWVALAFTLIAAVQLSSTHV